MKKIDESTFEVFVHEKSGTEIYIAENFSKYEKEEILDSLQRFIDQEFRDKRRDN